VFLIKNLKLKNGVMINWNWDGAPIHLVGPNGCGKSLLLKSLAQLFPTEYEVFQFQSKPVGLYDPQVYRSEVLYIPPQSSLIDCTTVIDFMNKPRELKIYKGHAPSPECHHYLEKWGLDKKLISELSSGEKQIISLLRALGLKAKVLLLDEAFTHIDQEKKVILMNLLMDWTKKKESSFILISHESLREEFNQIQETSFSTLSHLGQ
jgi:ABC-type iron transport system FetAB ATPase subunit